MGSQYQKVLLKQFPKNPAKSQAHTEEKFWKEFKVTFALALF
jgi:hypothetical protein